MPLVRIDLLKGRPEAERAAIGDAVHAALVSIGVPADDRFQVIAEHDPANFRHTGSYLGITYTDGLVIVQVTFNEGRTTEQKKALFKALAEGVHAAANVRPQDIFVGLVEVKRENWSFGEGVAQYADA